MDIMEGINGFGVLPAKDNVSRVASGKTSPVQPKPNLCLGFRWIVSALEAAVGRLA